MPVTFNIQVTPNSDNRRDFCSLLQEKYELKILFSAHIFHYEDELLTFCKFLALEVILNYGFPALVHNFVYCFKTEVNGLQIYF